MKKFFLISILMGGLPLSMVAQDDLYFTPKKKSEVKVNTDNRVVKTPAVTDYSASRRNVDEYNRMPSHYEVIENDTTTDIIDFDGAKGVYPDSVVTEDFALTKKMQRFEDYDLSDNAAFWAGYTLGSENRYAWYSPWYYRTYGFYGGWYDPWYYNSWYGSWYDPWSYPGWYGAWYDPWYGWGYYGWNTSWYYSGWYGWGYPYGYYSYYYGYPYYYGGGGGHHYTYYRDNTGSINRYSSSRSSYNRGSGALRNDGSRMTSLRNRTVGGHRAGGSTSGTRASNNNSNYRRSASNRSSSGNFGGTRNSGSYSNSSSSSSGGSFSSGGSRSSGGSFGGGGGSTRSSGGGGGGGGGRLGGRR